MAEGNLKLEVLGPARLVDADGCSIDAILGSPKRLALLTYLSCSPGLVGRDKLLGMFWAEADQSRARNSLNQLLHQIRRGIGADVLQSRGAEMIGVQAGRIHCDLREFDEAIKTGQCEDAVGLYGGEVLQGFYLPDARAFERWLENTRERARRDVVRCCRKLAGDASRPPERRMHWLRRATTIAPNDEVLVRELLIELDAAGNRAEAVRTFEAFRTRLERDLGTPPSPETEALLQEIRERDRARTKPALRPVGRAPAPAPPEARETPNSDEAAAEADGTGLRRKRWNGLRGERRRMPTGAAAAALLLAVSVVAFVLWRGTREARPLPSLDDGLVLAVPFEARGDDLEYLGQGMVDLLAIGLTGDGGPRAVEPGTALSAWRRIGSATEWSADVARDLGRATGAGRIIRGTIVEVPGGLQLAARLIDAQTGTTITTATSEADVGTGDGDGLWEATARLTARLLAGQLEGGRLLVAARAPPLAALKHYMAAREAYRDGRAVDAVDQYRSALEIDSTFAYAALGLLEVSQWPSVGLLPVDPRVRAHRLRARLAPRDTVYLNAIIGPNYPAASTSRAFDEAVATARSALPYRTEVVFEAADDLFHGGTQLDVAEAGFRRALELDPGYSVALHHLVQSKLVRGDLAAAAELADRYRREFPRADHVRSMEWAMAHLTRDEEALSDFWNEADELPDPVLVDVFLWTYTLGFPVNEAFRALEEGWRRGNAPEGFLRYYQYFTDLNAGRPAAAARVRDGDSRPELDPIVAALYSVGDSGTAAAHAAALSRVQDAPVAGDKWDLAAQAHGTCVLEQWRLWHGRRPGTLERSIGRILEAQSRAPEVEGRQNLHTCVMLLRALDAVLAGQPDAGILVARADSAFREGPGGPQFPYARLLLARLFERLDDPEAALRNLRDRCRFCPASVYYLADRLREEGRLAAALGDRAGALDAYRRYLVLRGEPEPAVQPQVDSVRRELAALQPDS